MTASRVVERTERSRSKNKNVRETRTNVQIDEETNIPTQTLKYTNSQRQTDRQHIDIQIHRYTDK
jgi:hypothetical protein